jgi:hypothetical protein
MRSTGTCAACRADEKGKTLRVASALDDLLFCSTQPFDPTKLYIDKQGVNWALA